MTRQMLIIIGVLTLSLSLTSCGIKQSNIAINSGSVPPGSMITKGNAKLSLIGTPIEVGQRLPATDLVDAKTMSAVNLNDYNGKVLFLSIVPSIAD